MNGRYKLYGVVPSEHEAGNKDLNPGNQPLAANLPVYATDDQKEAERLFKAGGFMRGADGGSAVWCAVQWAEDTETGRVIGKKP
jgi:hypothetical protein